MGAFNTSFEFHRELESPLDFIRREWLPVIVFGGCFTALMFAVVLLIDQSFFYPRLQTDALLYYLKAKSLADAGTTAARVAINVPPFPYASMPGAMRAPLLWLFHNFDDQLRAIQVANIAITDAIALMAAYIVSWVVPRSRQWMAIGFVFGFMLLTPWWMANVFFALADTPYAAFSLASTIAAVRIITSPRPLDRPLQLLGFSALFVAAFLFRYTEPVVIVLAAALWKGRLSGRKLPATTILTITIVTAALIALLVFLNRDAIFGRYIAEPIALFARSDKQSMILNFFLLAVPEQVVPGFALGFSHSPIIDLYHAEFASNGMDVLWSVVGATLTAVVFIGAWNIRGRMLPEILMLVCVIPVLVVIMPSTSRYFMTYEPFFWIAFYEGARVVVSRIPGIVRQPVASHAGAFATVALLAGAAMGLRARERQEGSVHQRLAALGDLPGYVRGVSGTYRPLTQFLQTLPPARSILTGARGSLGRWKAISNLDYYSPDSGLVALAAHKDVYVVLDCGSVAYCARAPEFESWVKTTLCQFGEFDYQLVFEAKAEKSAARVYRLRPAA
ncbi:MAG: hypothetical protein ABIQ55_00385 [Gemmatimonadaceae bacterium]